MRSDMKHCSIDDMFYTLIGNTNWEWVCEVCILMSIKMIKSQN